MSDEGAKPQDELLDGLDFDEGPKVPKKEPYVAYSRDLTEADLAALSLPRGVTPKSLTRIYASHHSLARCLAAGMKPSQAALVTGYSPSRVSLLQRDQAFASLVADYRAEAKSVFADLAERMSDLSLDAIDILHERLHEDPGAFTVPVLLDLVKAMADRTGHGPGQEVHLKVDRDFIDRPPRENFEEWKARRELELTPQEPKKLN